MKYVLDSSVGFKFAVIEGLTDKARKLRDDFRAGIHELFAPDIYPVEVTHALTRAERQRRITPTEGARFFADLMGVLPHLAAYMPLLAKAHAISSRMRVGVYDCLYVALAEDKKCDLVTADDKLVKKLQVQFPFIRHLSTLP